MRTEENQLDATECFIALIICSTCFGHLYAHHQELETILMLLPHVVCNALVAGGRQSGDRWPPATKALHTTCGNNTSIVSSSWCWAYKCLKHVEQIISAINRSVASSWFSSLCIPSLLVCYACTLVDRYVVGSISFRPDQLWKVTEMKQLCYFSI